jgi:hypothetical protein
MDLEVHLIQRFLYVQNVFRRHLDEAFSVAPQRANRANHSWGTEAGPQQPHGVQILNPLAIGDFTLSAGNVLEVVRIDQEDLAAAGLQNLVHRNPIDACGLHRHGANAAALQPTRKFVEISGKCRVAAHWFWIAIGGNCDE